MSNRYIDFDLIKKAPNKYNIAPGDIQKLRVLDWDKLKKLTWFNKAMSEPCWCHIEGSDSGGYFGDDVNEFWIGFYENGKVDYHFSCYDGMCYYFFTEFYQAKDIENKHDLAVQVNAMRYLNKILDKKIVELSKN